MSKQAKDRDAHPVQDGDVFRCEQAKSEYQSLQIGLHQGCSMPEDPFMGEGV